MPPGAVVPIQATPAHGLTVDIHHHQGQIETRPHDATPNSRPTSATPGVGDAHTPHAGAVDALSPNKKRQKQNKHKIHHKEYDSAEDLKAEVEKRFTDRDNRNNYDLREHMVNDDYHIADPVAAANALHEVLYHTDKVAVAVSEELNRSRPTSSAQLQQQRARRRSLDALPGSPVLPMSLVHSSVSPHPHTPHALPGAASHHPGIAASPKDPSRTESKGRRRNSFG